MTIASGILDVAVAAAEKEGAERIVRVNVLVGELRGIVPLQLTFCFGVLAEGTIAKDACLNMEITPVTGRCRDCAETFIVKDYVYQCPKCGSLDIQTMGGTELRVSDIDVE
jgi:hydrogenase nickel incorporation protein HypA/HybF